MARLGNIKDIYSEDTLKAQDTLAEVESSKPGEYQSQYSGKMNEVLNNILNRKEFSYDFNADPMYQQYKDTYTQLGNQAMQNTVASAAAMTGGYGNSYGVTAGAQANQAYLQQLNSVIPELYNAALQKYDMDTQNMYNQFSALGSQEDREYGKYRDTVGDWQTDRGYYNDKFNTAVSNDQYVSDYNQTEEQNERQYQMWLAEMQYQQARDAVADSQWQQQWDYQLQQDALAAAQKASGSSRSSKSSKKSSNSTKSNSLGNTYAAINYLTGETSPAGSINVYDGIDKVLDYEQKMANFIKNHSGDSEAYERYLVDEVNKGNLSMQQATMILQNLG